MTQLLDRYKDNELRGEIIKTRYNILEPKGSNIGGLIGEALNKLYTTEGKLKLYQLGVRTFVDLKEQGVIVGIDLEHFIWTHIGDSPQKEALARILHLDVNELFSELKVEEKTEDHSIDLLNKAINALDEKELKEKFTPLGEDIPFPVYYSNDGNPQLLFLFTRNTIAKLNSSSEN